MAESLFYPDRILDVEFFRENSHFQYLTCCQTCLIVTVLKVYEASAEARLW